MIINSIGNTKITIGETQEYKATIDIENLDFIATLLSSNLYSNPEDSFIREIVSNGWDSHVEAGTTDTPIIIKCKDNSWSDCNITIRDYGTGLSKEDFENLYCKIGGSTKRDSNEYIGCFGLGHLSPLSVSKVVYITSYYNGIARFYIMTKDGNSITTNLISEQPTTEKNGLEITIKHIDNKYIYKNAIRKLAFFPNVFVEGIGEELNTIKTKRYKNFSIASTIISDKILLGNVLYPLKSNFLPTELKSAYALIQNTGLVFNFNIGELAVTPNRESIIYNTNTETLIINRIKEAFNEVSQIISKNIILDYENPYTYYNDAYKDFEYDFFENKILSYGTRQWGGYPAFNNKYLNIPFTLKGKALTSMPNYDYTRSIQARPGLRGVIGYDKVWTTKYPWEAQQIIKKADAKIIVIPSDKKLSAHLKAYLVDNYNNSIICNPFDFNEFLDLFSKSLYIHAIDIRNNQNLLHVAQCCYDWAVKKCVTKDFETEKDFIEYREARKKEAKENKTINIKKIILNIHKPNTNYAHKKTFYSYKDALDYIKGLKTGVLFRNLDKMSITEITSKLGYTVIGANKDVIALLQKENLKCAITEDTILNHPDLVFVNSVKSTNFPSVINSDYEFGKTLPKELLDFVRHYGLLKIKLGCYGFYSFLDNNNVPVDEGVVNMANTIKKCYTSYCGIVEQFASDRGGDLYRDAISYIIMKNKLYKISYDCYKTIKENKLLSLLCTK